MKSFSSSRATRTVFGVRLDQSWRFSFGQLSVSIPKGVTILVVSSRMVRLVVS